eukprot:CAMPEP_0184439248 /NCGR_PEP_ID=MMETSP0738-20130409/699412_1 /TAXON_ID=385413 /ORGANISM="Thalassiosira miniscula, Strain CCMP1093" /LENGTH=220 /DNA_ID=CAMNT_0026806821 /DNA_START=14 /DNA_END=675 /DNA_ORIENTATION=-
MYIGGVGAPGGHPGHIFGGRGFVFGDQGCLRPSVLGAGHHGPSIDKGLIWNPIAFAQPAFANNLNPLLCVAGHQVGKNQTAHFLGIAVPDEGDALGHRYAWNAVAISRSSTAQLFLIDMGGVQFVLQYLNSDARAGIATNEDVKGGILKLGPGVDGNMRFRQNHHAGHARAIAKMMHMGSKDSCAGLFGGLNHFLAQNVRVGQITCAPKIRDHVSADGHI